MAGDIFAIPRLGKTWLDSSFSLDNLKQGGVLPTAQAVGAFVETIKLEETGLLAGILTTNWTAVIGPIRYPVHLNVDTLTSHGNPSGLSSAVSRYYKVDNTTAAIARYLDEHSDLLLPLVVGALKVRKLFGAEADLFLKLHFDDEVPASEHLFASVVTSLDVETAVRNLDRIHDDWWLLQPIELRSLLTFDLVFRS